MTLVEDLQAFVKEESLPTPRWPRQHVLKFNQTEIKLEAALAGIMVLSARAISTPTDHQSDFSWNKSWIHYLHQAGILSTSETTPAAERIAATLFNKVGTVILLYGIDGTICYFLSDCSCGLHSYLQ